ncbi:DUF4279 domain-containing protein [Synechococcus sp. PCC 7336]|uniref:DUF4279 domain-containing protein n=1 Tax=Synechococcus sp. PCC 7336 TaxID=195250 RepID=UPI0012EAFD5D|nr:DUF4279 domain-containing protein [Synechococcus sp. PCC 7336]
MTKLNLSLRLRGELPTLKETNKILGIQASSFYQKGELVGRNKKRTQPHDVWILNLTPNLDHNSSITDIENDLLEAITSLEAVLPRLESFNIKSFEPEIYISLLQESDQGGFRLPYQLIQVIAKVNIPMTVSVIAI